MKKPKSGKSVSIKSATKSASARKSDPFDMRPAAGMAETKESQTHVYGDKVVCNTDSRGLPTPQGKSPLEIVLDASRSEERRVGKECLLECRSRWSPYH